MADIGHLVNTLLYLSSNDIRTSLLTVKKNGIVQ